MLLAPPALGWMLGDVFELLANAKMNAALYSIISQLRLVGTAAMMCVVLGKRQTLLQTLLLLSISCTILVYTQVPDSVAIGEYWTGFGKPQAAGDQLPEEDDPTGLIYAFVKVGLTIFSGVLGQRALQDEQLKEVPIYTFMAMIFGLQLIPMLSILLVHTAYFWDYGVFGGANIEFRHCSEKALEECSMQNPVAVQEQGWDARVLVLMCFYIIREPITRGVLRVFSALVKDLVNAGSTVTTYFLSIAFLGKEFNAAKFVLTFGAVLQIWQYSLAPKAPDVPLAPPAKDTPDVELARSFVKEDPPKTPGKVVSPVAGG